MTDKEFKRLSRPQLIEVIYQLQLQVDKLTEQNRELERKLTDKRLRLSNAGNIADAALEGIILRITKERGFSSKPHRIDDLTAFLISQHIGCSIAIRALHRLVVVIVQQIQCGAVPLNDREYLPRIQVVLRPLHDPYHLTQFLDTGMIDSIALHYVLPENTVCPLSEFHATLGLNPIANGDDHIQIVVIHHVGFAVSGSCRKFCDNWNSGQFFT